MFASFSFYSYAASSLLLFSALSPLASAHMEMSQPLPPHSQYNPALLSADIDYNLKSPLTANGSNFPCHGYQNDRPIVVTATYSAGKTYQMAISGTVTHGGGSCQLSLSYDNGGTFKVIKSMIGGCPLTQQYDFTIPSFAPSGNALFAWTWFNEIGNREMYMSCAQVQIVGSSATRRSRAKRQSTFTSMSSLPNIWRANIAGLDQCVTVEGSDPVFPNLGPDVVFGGSSSSSSPKNTQQGCDSSSPSGQTFQGAGNAGTPSQVSPALSSALTTATTSITTATAVTPSSGITRSGGVFAEGAGNSTSTSTTSSTTPTIATSTSTPSTLLVPTSNSTVTSATSAIPSTAPDFAGFLTFAGTTNNSNYLPCVPGAFLCTSATTYLICDQADGATPMLPSSKYIGPQSVAAGMQCVPFLAKFLTPQDSTKFVNAQDVVPSGYYRSDRYVGA